MRHRYELLNVVTSNLIGTYPDQGSALDVIRDEIKAHGDGRLHDVGLARFTIRGDLWPIAEGPGLVALAMREPAQPGRERRLRRTRTRSKVVARRGRVARREAAVV